MEVFNPGATMTFQVRFSIWLAASFLIADLANCQTLAQSEGLIPPGMQAGPVAGAYALSGFETVNLFNGKVSFNFPLIQIGGRGQGAYTMTLPVESANWQIIPDTPTQDSVQPVWSEVNPAGLGPGGLKRRSMAIQTTTQCGTSGPIVKYLPTYTTYVLSRPGGGSLEFFPRDNPNPKTWTACAVIPEADFSRGNVFVTRDGSAATMVLTTAPIENSDAFDGYKGDGEETGYVKFKDGLRYNITRGEVKSIVDRNGNKTTFEYHPASGTPTSAVLNVNTTGQSFDVNLPSSIAANSGGPINLRTPDL